MKAILPLLVGLSMMPACGCSEHHVSAQTQPPPPAPTVNHEAFDADEAFRYLKAQCDLGPRVPNSVAHEACKDYIIKTIKPYVDNVSTQPFEFYDGDRDIDLKLTNILALINPSAKTRVMLFTHWDTRPTADQELDKANRKKPIPGADDGASGTAVLMELARTFHDKRPKVCVELLFVDGEDWGPQDDHMYLGARHFAEHPGPYKPDYAVLLDMIGAKDLQIHRESTSENLHPELDNKVWQAAADLGYSKEFPNDTKYTITDDHDSFNDAGIPAIDLIDFDYAYWHTLDDTPDKCSPDSLKIVGETMARVVYAEQ